MDIHNPRWLIDKTRTFVNSVLCGRLLVAVLVAFVAHVLVDMTLFVCLIVSMIQSISEQGWSALWGDSPVAWVRFNETQMGRVITTLSLISGVVMALLFIGFWLTVHILQQATDRTESPDTHA